MLRFRNLMLISSPPPQPPSTDSLSENLENDLSGAEEKVCGDCGNRAKKECAFGRCRTCCKSRGYDCATHVKSTWVPASQRRDRKFTVAGAVSGSGPSCPGSKKQRTEVSEQNNAAKAPLGLQTSSSHQGFKEALPGKVQAPAVFRRIRVTAITNGEAEVAYQATVTISGHVFKGFLYNYGGVDQNNPLPRASSKLPTEN
ncbi:PREDICTED: protein SHI RELATED SEQUENCE 6 [Tarenaya hassleriana]|uniref:protein SHI RELATED SEQUENCE 6 n=1 Tax=Tarenaya hassleriana TaxID=28532 RepID=UPI00053C951C|nr:PREDICTED: protein SHI RELATED SEQUENCE 6 [Tarenaya hassleriana]XP_010554484.1 PREDICTED: protein SHI RELATED SEQUENCE 6 [Tarenaya hassleriana]XP_010554486.1 PREDICTED: protein SHI RELATED SEQUENCE 6 [Tarenaya hassleriana]